MSDQEQKAKLALAKLEPADLRAFYKTLTGKDLTDEQLATYKKRLEEARAKAKPQSV